LRTTLAAGVAAALILIVPALADAQGRRAVPRVIRSRPAVSVGLYYGPSVYYRPWYGSRYYWYDPFYSYSYPYPYYSAQWPPYYYGRGFDISASLRLQVSPRQAEVFVDGYYAGTVDDFDGVFQRLHLEPGEHDLEVFLPGHRSLQQRVYLQPGRTFSVRHAMEPLAAGDPEPVRPSGGSARPPNPQATSPRSVPPVRPRDPDRGPGREPAAGTRAEFGSLSLRVQPGDATITIDGEAWESSGDNERFIVQLGAGVHNVEIRKDGYRTYITDVTVRPDDTTTLNVALTPNR
jgi:hypothetical protein